MKKYILSFIILLTITACNNADNKKGGQGQTEAPKTKVDSLMADVMDGHDVGMSKMGKINRMQKNVEDILDSIAKLPAKAKIATGPLKVKMEDLLRELKIAKAGMEKWMDEFNMDSAVNNMEQRIKYLGEEKLKVSKVKGSILSALAKADSLIKK
jgi:hypothetical protein